MNSTARLPRPLARSGSRRARWLGPAVLVALLAQMIVPAAPAHALTGPVGSAVSWGANAYGELGWHTPLFVPEPDQKSKVKVVGLGSGVARLVAGARHSLAILSNGAVKAWGKGASGELGNGLTTGANVPVQVTGLGANSGVIAVAGNAQPLSAVNVSGPGHSMALKANGAVLGWGNNNSGQVGDGTIIDQVTPVGVSTLGAGSTVIAIAAGGAHSLALKSNGTVLAWGNNASGQLGVNNLVDSALPVQVSGLGAGSGVIAIAAGSAFSMALKSNGTVFAWGNNGGGELGNNTIVDSPIPVQVKGVGGVGFLTGVTRIAAGAAFSVALKSNGTVFDWGNNASGQLGNNTAPTDKLTPVQVSAVGGVGVLTGITAITAGFSHAIALRSDARLVAWGRNTSGQLGDGTLIQRNVPTLLPYFNIMSVSAGGSHTLALPGIRTTPLQGIPGQAVTVNGSYFKPAETVQVRYMTGLALPAPAFVVVCSGVATTLGTFACTGPVPTANYGLAGFHTIQAVGLTSLITSTTTFKLIPSLTVAPAAGVAGVGVTITGKVFKPSEVVKVYYKTGLVSPASTLICTATANTIGTVTCPALTTHIPTTNQGALGIHQISGIGQTSLLVANANFTLQ